ncbi:hypothetical protein G6F57_008895 [Rhizopus arrhizus]|uniref:Uncharacterized protein n=1 Tax=Rhizopus oryzae TaxID=64495 RepID=A0A9P6XA93_RHIOR|nr:hypothetical protein G6F23_010594 [Rhizopus arrhizus]KAG1410759.1 hypothetical protein G6F58_008928 [Rhizopus delemar]KAG0759446.1 hypothetical protein G6F24_009057 [Rhizopus arrhizus]KAG0782872.1 hypothetical protein G6F21_010865 [Rhizopus arrhizus]KAG0808613.1 hypothetical protein G6F20_009431 [Rhizopus arrhizus]
MTSFDFQPPMNMNAIRSSIVQRIKQRNVEKTCLDNGLPSPPIDTFESTKLPTDQVMNALYELSSDDKPLSPVSTTSTSSSSSSSNSSEELDKESIRQRIKLLQEEKHKLFQMMKDLLNNKPNIQRSRSMSHTEHPPHTRPISRYNNTMTTTNTTSNLCTFPSTNHHTRRYISSRPPIRSNSYSYSSFRTMNRYNSRH